MSYWHHPRHRSPTQFCFGRAESITERSQAQHLCLQPKLNHNQIPSGFLGCKFISGQINVNFDFLVFIKRSRGPSCQQGDAKPGTSTFPPVLIHIWGMQVLGAGRKSGVLKRFRYYWKPNSGFGSVAQARSADNRNAGFCGCIFGHALAARLTVYISIGAVNMERPEIARGHVTITEIWPGSTVIVTAWSRTEEESENIMAVMVEEGGR